MTSKVLFDSHQNNYNTYSHIKSKLIFAPQNKIKYKYSITIPTFKRIEYLFEAVDSCLKQTYSNIDWQIVIVDNDPEYNSQTEIAIKQFSTISNLFYYKNEENIGLYGNWNRCIELADGEYVVILSDDDVLRSDYLLEMTNLINKYPKINLLYSAYDYFGPKVKKNENKDRLIHRISKQIQNNTIRRLTLIDYFINKFGFSSSCMIFRRSLALKVGGHDISLFPASDYYFQSNYVKNFGHAYYFNKILASYRIDNNESMKREVSDKIPDMMYLIKTQMINHLPHLLKRISTKIAIYKYQKDVESIHLNSGHDFSDKLVSLDNMFKTNIFKKKYFGFFEKFIGTISKVIGFLNLINFQRMLRNNLH